jgi:hypothetical protein
MTAQIEQDAQERHYQNRVQSGRKDGDVMEDELLE